MTIKIRLNMFITVCPLWPYAPYPQSQPTTDQKYSENKCYVIADVYDVIRPMIVSSVLNMYRLFSCHCSLTIQYKNHLPSSYTVVGNTNNLGMI